MAHLGEGGMQANTGEHAQHQAPYFGFRDLIFVAIAAVVAVLVVQLGYHTWADGNNTEMTKAQGEELAAWLTEQGNKRAEGQDTDVSACNRSDGKWIDCREALIAPGGPFEKLTNVFSKDNVLFSPVCDRTQLNTHGSIMVEKGLPKPPDGASLIYSPIADDEPLSENLALRISICGRGFSTIHIAEFKF